MLSRLKTLPTEAVVTVICLILLLNILVAWFHYNGLNSVPPEQRKIKAELAWLMVIPIVHTVFIWIISIFKLPSSYQLALGDDAQRFGTCNRRLGLAWAIVATTLFLPVIDILSFVAYVVLMIIYWVKLNKMRHYLLSKLTGNLDCV